MLPVVVQLDMAQPYFRLMANEFALSSQQDLVFLQFLVGIFGPTIASWGVLFWAVVTQSFALPTKGAILQTNGRRIVQPAPKAHRRQRVTRHHRQIGQTKG